MARAVDNTLLHALNTLACQVSKGTQQTWDATQHVLNYIACNPTPAIKCKASDMILEAESDAAFDVTTDVQSRAVGRADREDALVDGAVNQSYAYGNDYSIASSHEQADSENQLNYSISSF